MVRDNFTRNEVQFELQKLKLKFNSNVIMLSFLYCDSDNISKFPFNRYYVYFHFFAFNRNFV